MRTSRIARETAVVMRALSSPSSSRKFPARPDDAQTRRVSDSAAAPEQREQERNQRAAKSSSPPSIRPAANHDNGAADDHERGSSSSELSSVPSSDGGGGDSPDPFRGHRQAPAKPTTTASLSSSTRKRKRSGTAPASETKPPPSPSFTASIADSSRARTSPTLLERAGDARDGTVNTSTKAKKARRAPAKKAVAADGSVKVEPPPNWEEMYGLTAEMRSRVVAPVDTMGCESLADRKDSPLDQRLQTLVALMLSSQTKDTVTSVAMKNLQDNLPGGFNLRALLEVEPARLNSLIEKVGFHNNKTKYIKQTAEILRDKFDGDIPDTIEGLVSLPGVGPKMAYLCMSAAWGRDEGIGVDVHVHRITNLWGWHKTRNPEETRAALEAWLPREKWHAINHLLVGFGQTICLPVGRKCGECTLAEKGLCPGAVVAKKQTTVKKDRSTVKVELDGETVKQEIVKEVAVERNVKAEDIPEASVMDIEDIGKPRSTRSSRRR
ncbi:endonuclease iii [Diplodia corticola]|uniref:Endonuclease III homolog n=1 Tax=Diplodia corticola TaxID=236234 RepID=A0A1J9S2I6_9PEZI|nr:endonuclease iii [Diplodia corticola]OJD34220.1 endonuclease iii [Diplodia corticola]